MFSYLKKMGFSRETRNDLMSGTCFCQQRILFQCHSYIIHKDIRHTQALSIDLPLKLLVDESNAGKKTLVWVARPHK